MLAITGAPRLRFGHLSLGDGLHGLHLGTLGLIRSVEQDVRMPLSEGLGFGGLGFLGVLDVGPSTVECLSLMAALANDSRTN